MTKTYATKKMFPDGIFREIVIENRYNHNKPNVTKSDLKRMHQICITGVKSLRGLKFLPNLEFIDLNYCPNLMKIDVSKNKKLKRIIITNSGIRGTLDLRNNPEITDVDISNTQIKTILFSKKYPDKLREIGRDLICINCPLESFGEEFDQILVYESDAFSAGLCKELVISFINKHLNGKKEVTIKELLKISRKIAENKDGLYPTLEFQDISFAAGACLYAIARHLEKTKKGRKI